MCLFWLLGLGNLWSPLWFSLSLLAFVWDLLHGATCSAYITTSEPSTNHASRDHLHFPSFRFLTVCLRLEAASLPISSGQGISTQPQFRLFPKWRACDFLPVRLIAGPRVDGGTQASFHKPGRKVIPGSHLPLPTAKGCYCCLLTVNN